MGPCVRMSSIPMLRSTGRFPVLGVKDVIEHKIIKPVRS